MLALPPRVEVKARLRPSGEYSGRPSVAGPVRIKCAAPPLAGTSQMSPPDAKPISWPSADRLGSDRTGFAAGTCAIAGWSQAIATHAAVRSHIALRITTPPRHQS